MELHTAVSGLVQFDIEEVVHHPKVVSGFVFAMLDPSLLSPLNILNIYLENASVGYKDIKVTYDGSHDHLGYY